VKPEILMQLKIKIEVQKKTCKQLTKK